MACWAICLYVLETKVWSCRTKTDKIYELIILVSILSETKFYVVVGED